MIGALPTSIDVNGNRYAIRTDFRDCLRIFEVFADEDLDIQQKVYVSMVIFYKDFNRIPEFDYENAYKQMIWFLDGGDFAEDDNGFTSKPVMDWKQDERLYFPAINKVAGREVRELKYLHFWTFLGYYMEIGDGTFATVVAIRNKKNKRMKLEKHEEEFYRRNKAMIDLKRKYTDVEQRSMAAIDKLLGRG